MGCAPATPACSAGRGTSTQLSRRGGGLVRGHSKENIRVEVRAAAAIAGKCSRAQDPLGYGSHEQYADEHKFQDFGPPSAPPIAPDGGIFDTIDAKGGFERTGISSVADILAQDVHELPTKIPSFTTNVQNAWQSFVAYDACFRLCLNAWAKNCMEAPEFLRDECMVLRSAFGIQNFLLHPRYKNQDDGKHTYDKDETCSIKARKVVKQIEIEVDAMKAPTMIGCWVSDGYGVTWMLAIDHIINSAAKSNYMPYGQINVLIVFRGPNGAADGVRAQYSQTEREGKGVTITAFSKMVSYALQGGDIYGIEEIL